MFKFLKTMRASCGKSAIYCPTTKMEIDGSPGICTDRVWSSSAACFLVAINADDLIKSAVSISATIIPLMLKMVYF
jgi:hypothetical protein